MVGQRFALGGGSALRTSTTGTQGSSLARRVSLWPQSPRRSRSQPPCDAPEPRRRRSQSGTPSNPVPIALAASWQLAFKLFDRCRVAASRLSATSRGQQSLTSPVLAADLLSSSLRPHRFGRRCPRGRRSRTPLPASPGQRSGPSRVGVALNTLRAPDRAGRHVADHVPHVRSAHQGGSPSGGTRPVDDACELADLQSLVEQRGHQRGDRRPRPQPALSLSRRSNSRSV